jgi:hypothetical protein
MLAPDLGARVEQGNYLAGLRVFGLRLGVFKLIALTAGQPKVLTTIGTTKRKWDEVIDSQRDTHEGLFTKTVSAAIIGVICNLAPQ